MGRPSIDRELLLRIAANSSNAHALIAEGYVLEPRR
jgi:hypothetical protein